MVVAGQVDHFVHIEHLLNVEQEDICVSFFGLGVQFDQVGQDTLEVAAVG